MQIFQKIFLHISTQLFAPVFPVVKEDFLSLHLYKHHILCEILTLIVLNLMGLKRLRLKSVTSKCF